jgi:hypothetical protein
VLHDTAGNGWVFNSLSPVPGWQLLSQIYTVSSNGAMRVALIAPGGSGTIYWDDVSVIPLPPDPGFENASLYPWLTYAQGNGTVGLGGLSAARLGDNGLALTPNGGYVAAYQDITGLPPGKIYTVFVWVRSAAPTTDPVELVVHDTAGNGVVFSSIVPGPNWQLLGQTYQVSANGAMRIAFVAPGGNAVTYWDDVSFFP